jgi:hypothetical protein
MFLKLLILAFILLFVFKFFLILLSWILFENILDRTVDHFLSSYFTK